MTRASAIARIFLRFLMVDFLLFNFAIKFDKFSKSSVFIAFHAGKVKPKEGIIPS